MKDIKILSVLMGLFFMLVACSSEESLSEKKLHKGYFISVFDKKVDYSCENERQSMGADGKFECASFPIAFYMNNTKIGEISTINQDGYVYPQDIIHLEERTAIYTSGGNMNFLAVEEGL